MTPIFYIANKNDFNRPIIDKFFKTVDDAKKAIELLPSILGISLEDLDVTIGQFPLYDYFDEFKREVEIDIEEKKEDNLRPIRRRTIQC